MRMRKNCKRRYGKNTEEIRFYWKGTNLLTVLMVAATIATLLGAGMASGFTLVHGAHAFKDTDEGCGNSLQKFGEHVSSMTINCKGKDKLTKSEDCGESLQCFGGYVSSLASNSKESGILSGCGECRYWGCPPDCPEDWNCQNFRLRCGCSSKCNCPLACYYAGGGKPPCDSETKWCYQTGCGAYYCIYSCTTVCADYFCGYIICDCGGSLCGSGPASCPGTYCKEWSLGCPEELCESK